MTDQTELDTALTDYEVDTETLDSFVHHNKKLIDEYNQLILQRNNAIDALKHQITQNVDILHGRCGPYKINVPRKLNAETLASMCPGEIIDTYVKWKPSVITAAFDNACDQGVFGDEVIDAVIEKGSPRVSGPKPISIYVCS